MSSTGYVIGNNFQGSASSDLAKYLPVAAGFVSASGSAARGYNYSSYKVDNSTGRYQVNITSGTANAVGAAVITPYNEYIAWTVYADRGGFQVQLSGGGTNPQPANASFSFIFV